MLPVHLLLEDLPQPLQLPLFELDFAPDLVVLVLLFEGELELVVHFGVDGFVLLELPDLRVYGVPVAFVVFVELVEV